MEQDRDNARARRRLRRSRDPVTIVRTALAEHWLFKDATHALSRCEPSAAAAEALLEAHDTAQAPSWLVACLLGFVRHPSGYPRVLEILARGDRFLSEDYAASAAVQIAGAQAQTDLERVIDTVENGAVRKAAASAIGSIGTPEAIGLLVAALARGRLRALTVARALSTTPVEPETLIDALRSTHREVRRWPAMLMAERLRTPRLHEVELRRCAASLPLCAALTSLLEEDTELVWPGDAARIRTWLESIPE